MQMAKRPAGIGVIVVALEVAVLAIAIATSRDWTGLPFLGFLLVATVAGAFAWARPTNLRFLITVAFTFFGSYWFVGAILVRLETGALPPGLSLLGLVLTVGALASFAVSWLTLRRTPTD
jgi:hypothetical protein